MTRYEDRAARGAHYLDERYRDWDAEINTDKLDMGNGDYDVLGQMFGAYEDGVAHLNLPFPSVVELGFHLPIGWERIFGWLNYPKLTEAWRNEIQRRADRRAERIAESFRKVLDKSWRDKPGPS